MIRILAVGKIKEPALTALIDQYLKRINRFTKINCLEVTDVAESKDDYSIKAESEALLKRLKTSDYVVLLDLSGILLNSLTLACELEKWISQSGELTFVIGGSRGVDQRVKQRADFVWQLSPLTFPHQIARLLLVEQLYRGYKINTKQSYHK